MAEEHVRTVRSDTEMDIQAGGEAGTSQSQSGHMTNIYLMESHEEATVDFVKDHKVVDKTNEQEG